MSIRSVLLEPCFLGSGIRVRRVLEVRELAEQLVDVDDGAEVTLAFADDGHLRAAVIGPAEFHGVHWVPFGALRSVTPFTTGSAFFPKMSRGA